MVNALEMDADEVKELGVETKTIELTKSLESIPPSSRISLLESSSSAGESTSAQPFLIRTNPNSVPLGNSSSASQIGSSEARFLGLILELCST